MKAKKVKPVLSDIELILSNFESTLNGYPGYLDYDYSTSYNCSKEGYDCDGICRCGRIGNVKINSIDIDYFLQTITKKCKDQILTYCVDRILRNSGMVDLSSWNVRVCGGYYGEEIGGAELIMSVNRETIAQIKALDGLSDIERIKRVLEFEYGYLLDSLKKVKTVEIREVLLEDVKLPNEMYGKKLRKEGRDYYQDFKLPRAICSESTGGFKIIDGYHRIISANKNSLKKIEIIILK